MTSLRFKIARLVAVLAAATTIWACNAPFIPVPPPGSVSFSSQVVSDGAAGTRTLWTATGGAGSDASLARFFLFDVQRNAGVIAAANASGDYTAPTLEGTKGDQIQIQYETPAGDVSPTACVWLAEGKAITCDHPAPP